jgi:pyruvate kinase
MPNLKRTKIIATLGPATHDLDILKSLILAGVNIVRLNFSHGEASDHAERARLVRQAALEVGETVAILADLQGPKIRIARFKDKKVFLQKGQQFILDSDLPNEAGDEHQVGIDYKNLPCDLKPGNLLLIDDGRLELTVNTIEGNKIICTVDVGGELSNNKGINKQGGGLSAEALTDKDKSDLKIATALGVDYIAISFPRSGQDMEYARSLVEQENSTAGLVAKIERAEALDVLDEIIKASDAVMVARGDLGVEIGDAELPAAQKKIIQRARALDKAVITATQMMESMIHSSMPTRAEVFDVANAIIDGTDAVMLSAETATGEYPLAVIQTVARVCRGAEKQKITKQSRHRVECYFHRVDEMIAMSAMYAANHMDIKAIISMTESGHTPLLMSRIRSGIPIYAFSRNEKTLRKVCLYRGIYPMAFAVTDYKASEINDRAIDLLKQRGIVKVGDKVIITEGDILGVGGNTNVMKIHTVG